MYLEMTCLVETQAHEWFLKSWLTLRIVLHLCLEVCASQLRLLLQPHVLGGRCVLMCSVTQSCPALCDALDCSPPASSVHGVFQARIIEWVVIFCRPPGDLPDPGVEPIYVSCVGRQILYHERHLGRLDLCICAADSLCCRAETNTTL